MSKIGPIVFTVVLTLLAGVSDAADKITLACSGTMWMKGLNAEIQALNPSFVIDLDQGIVTSSIGGFSITKQTENKIDFKGTAPNGVIAMGSVDWLSGFTLVTTSQGKETISNYQLTCKRANPLF